MKWLLGFLLFLNVFIFTLAYFADDEYQGYAPVAALPDKVQPIKLLGSTPIDGNGNCINLGPIERHIVVQRFTRILNKQEIAYQVISESKRMITAYRVVISANEISDIEALKNQLMVVGIDEVYEKTAASGDVYLSLGVFTYEKTARDFAANLTGSGFAASYQNELLEYPPRHWINLKKALDVKIVNSLNEYIGSNNLRQTAAACI